VTSLTNATDMFDGIALSTANYDALLNGWDAQALNSGVTFSGGNSTYCTGETARANMISSDSWTITDGGRDCPPVIQVDLSDSHTAPGGNWNTIPDASMNSTVSNLVDFNTGAATTVSYTGSGWSSPYDGETFWTSGDKDWVVDDAADDQFYTTGTATITFNGLNDSSRYIVEVVAAFSSDDVGDYTIGSQFADRTYECAIGVNGDDFRTNTDGRTPGNWLIWDNVAPSSGSITINFVDSTGSSYAEANAIRLVELDPDTPVTMDAGKNPQCSGGLTITDSTFLQDAGDQIDFFHNGLADNVDTDLGSSGADQRWARTWDCTVLDTNSNGGTVDVTFDFVLAGMYDSQPPAGDASNYLLLHRPGSSGDFSTIATGTSLGGDGWSVTFAGVSVDPATSLCSEITLGTTDASDSPTALTLSSFSARQNGVEGTATAFLAVLAPLAALFVPGIFIIIRRHQARQV
jgi:hypothetical protein